MTGLIVLLLVIDLGGSPTETASDSATSRTVLPSDPTPEPAALKACSSVVEYHVTALFAYTGTEIVGVTVGEAANPRKSVPSAIKKTFFRIAFFYVIGALLVGMVVLRTLPSSWLPTNEALRLLHLLCGRNRSSPDSRASGHYQRCHPGFLHFGRQLGSVHRCANPVRSCD